ncbi:MAG: hypothetical protein ABI378_04860 [Chitinophagaceae bacterium]
MLILFLLGILIYSNIRIAKKKGLNPLLWGVITFIAFFLSYALLGSIYIAAIYKGPVTRDALEVYLTKEPMAVLILTTIGVGGVLLVRYILEKKKNPTDNSPET